MKPHESATSSPARLTDSEEGKPIGSAYPDRLSSSSVDATARLIEAAERADWMQVVLNQGPPCFHYEADLQRFCLRAQRWAGHVDGGTYPEHGFVSLADLLSSSVDAVQVRVHQIEQERDEAKSAISEMEQFKPDAHRHMTLFASYGMLAGLFHDIGECHSILSRRGRVLGDRLPQRVTLLCERAEVAEARVSHLEQELDKATKGQWTQAESDAVKWRAQERSDTWLRARDLQSYGEGQDLREVRTEEAPSDERRRSEQRAESGVALQAQSQRPVPHVEVPESPGSQSQDGPAVLELPKLPNTEGAKAIASEPAAGIKALLGVLEQMIELWRDRPIQGARLNAQFVINECADEIAELLKAIPGSSS